MGSLTSTVGLLFLVGAAVINIILASAVFKSDSKNTTNRIFFYLSLTVVLWLSTYSVYLPDLKLPPLIMTRLGIFFAAPMSVLFFLLAHTIPNRKLGLRDLYLNIISVLTAAVMILNISPFAFVDASIIDGRLAITPGFGFIPFVLFSTFFSLSAIYLLFRKFKRAEGEIKHQIKLVLGGIVLMLVFVMITIPLPIIFLKSGVFVPLMPVYTLIFLGTTAYAITKYRLFNIKVFITQALTLVIWVTLFSKIFVATTFLEKGIDSIIFLITVLFGTSLIRSVRREIEQREKIEIQEKELEIANKQQENLIHFISHEVKGYLTNAQAAFASILQGDFGASTPEMKTMVDAALASTRKGSDTVKEILSAANIKKGTITYKSEPFDFKDVVKNATDLLRPVAVAKNLILEEQIGEGTFSTKGDKSQIEEHVIRNLIDNSIKYTPSGKITVGLEEKDGKILFSVKDTGVGITSEDKSRLFTEGGHGKDSIKVNAHSTGYGLFIAKNIVDAHHGRIWAESEGAGKGSQFYVELNSSK